MNIQLIAGLFIFGMTVYITTDIFVNKQNKTFHNVKTHYRKFKKVSRDINNLGDKK